MEPVVRLMVPCEDARPRKGSPGKIDLFGVISTVSAPADQFPVHLSFSVYLCLTNGRGQGSGKIVVAEDETNSVVYSGDAHPYDFWNDPILIVGSIIRVPLCLLPTPGLFRIEFVYNDAVVEKYPLLVRETT